MLFRSAAGYQSAEDFGFLIAGRFERGGHRGGGEMASVEARDRIRSLQLLLQALKAAETDPTISAEQKASTWMAIADQIGSTRYSSAWKLQLLSDLTKLPEPEQGVSPWMARGANPTSSAAPVDEQGQPVFHQLPQSWEAAVSEIGRAHV